MIRYLLIVHYQTLGRRYYRFFNESIAQENLREALQHDPNARLVTIISKEQVA